MAGPRFVPAMLRRQRQLAGKSAQQVAREVGRCADSISNYENGHTLPAADVLASLAAACGCGVGDFFTEPQAPKAAG
jgi:transcriptional regulator with XRE-family HTH domain